MGKYYTKAMCPQCMKPTLTVWPLLAGQSKPRRTCENLECRYKDPGA